MNPKATLSALVLLGSLVLLQAQEPSARPTFDVVSVRKVVDDSGPPGAVRRYPLDSPVYAPPFATAHSLILFAYDVSAGQVVGGPEWIGLDHFDVNARSAEPSTEDEKRLMVQSLLDDRFKLVVHTEQRTQEFGSLVLARDDGRLGEGLTPCDPSEPTGPIVVPRGARQYSAQCVQLSQVADVAARAFELPVVDKTGLDGEWNVVLTYADLRPRPTGVKANPDLAAFPTALKEQLGLGVEVGVGPFEVLVIDSIEQPTEN